MKNRTPLLPLLALALLAAPAFAAEYEISTLEELREFMEAVHVEDFAGDTITLTADIDCERGRFNTGDPEYPSTFRGTFDGGGHVISNFVHAATGSTQEGYGVAMFDFAETGAAILNLTLEGTLPGTASGAYAAPFVLAVESPLGLFMDNCHFRGSVTNYYHAAGLVGFASSGTGAGEVPSVALTNCSVRGEIVSTWVYTAGGLVAKGTGVQAFDCSVESELHGGRTGGLVGEAYGGSFEGCSFEGTMRPDRSSVSGCLNGGLVGEASNTVFHACTAAVELLDSKAASAGGAAAVTFGNTAFYDCSATLEATVPIGRYGGFVGWTAGAEVFSNCTASLTATATPVINYDAGTTNIYSLTTGGFAASVASDGALFVDCTASAGGGDLKAGFYYNQEPFSKNVTVGSNTFRRCHAVDSAASYAGFCSGAWNCAFEGCTVRGGTGLAGFVLAAGQRPDDSSSSSYGYEQTSTFEDCSVVGTRVRYGFVSNANTGDKNGSTNVFRRCRAGGNFGYHASSLSGYECGFAGGAYKGSLFEDCVGYGLVTTEGNDSQSTFGFAENIYTGATVRRCVGALLPRDYNKAGAGFAQYIAYGATVEDCYSVYGPRAAAVEPYSDQTYRYGIQGGFVTRTHIGYREGDDPIARCFALWPLPVPQSGNSYCGAFCGVTPYADYPPFFADCYRPAEAAVDDCHDADDENVAAFTAAQFASATAATMPNYDFQNVWHAPGGVASSPYLDASVNTNGEFWTFAAMASGEGRILVNGEAPKESYPAGSVLTIEAIPDNPDLPFTGWLGDNIADPASRVTTYTVRNVGAFGATFGIPIWTVDDWTNHLSTAHVSNPRETYALMDDLDFTGLDLWNQGLYVGTFQGKFFGLGHTISGVVVTNGNTQSTFALFASASAGAEIRDLTVESSTVTNRNNAIYIAGLVNEVGSGVLISNCHARADWQGCYTDWLFSGAYPACQFYGLAGSVSGAGIRVVDCSVEGTLAGMTEACGFVGSVDMNGGEIARCAVYANVSASTNRTNGAAAGFAGSLTLEGGAVVRECLAAGSVTASATGSGFANSITFRDSASSIRDCYSTMEVSTAGDRYSGGYNASGFADTISGAYDDPGATIANCWFGGSVRGGYQQHAFARSVDDYATLSNCRSVAAAGSRASATAGVASLAPDAARAAASWTGFDFENVWSLAEGATTPYFAWSLTTNGAFRVLAQEEPGTVIAHPATAAPGGAATIEASAEDADLFFCQWAGGATYTNAAVNPSAALADNHRAVRCVWGKAIATPEQLAAIADDPAGTYALAADIDLNGLDWTPICQDEYTPFTGTLYGNGHTISNLTVDTETARAGLFGGVEDGATIVDLHLANPVVRGANCVGTLAGYVNGANISGCTVVGADVAATSERAGCFVGQIEGATSVSRCSAVGDIAGEGRYTGGFVGSVEGSAAIEQCYALGSVTGTGGEGFGGFVGYTYGDSVSFSECFACGAVTASERNSVGGFAGYVSSSPAFSDCYALADARGASYVGGFAGQLYYSDTTFARCYAAGASVGSSDVGGFAGRQYRGSPSFTDCFRPANAPGDVGSADLVGIDALDATGFLDADNFAAYLDTGKWSQVDGKTQPYFAWGLQDGKMTLSGAIAGTGGGAITGLGAYAPGTVVPIAAVPDGSVFLGWLGNAPYADASDDTTTVTLDNFRIVTAEFGALITTRDQLAGVTNALSGSFALGADIDLTGAAWTPIGNNSTPFKGSLYARGHKITGLDLNSSSDYAGLFGVVQDATLDGIVIEGASLNGYRYTGALAGEVRGATTIRNCSASGAVTNSNAYAGLLVGRVYGQGGTTFDHCAATGTVVSAGENTGGLVGGVYYYPATFADCDADVLVTGTSGGNKGGFIGSVKDSSASATFARCAAWGDVVATNNSSAVGGFIGYANRAVSFEDCSAAGFAGGRGYTGGFAGQTTAASAFARCAAAGDVRGNGYTGGFVGQTSGANSRFEDCVAAGAVVSTSSQTGGFAGQSGGAGTVFADCDAAGGVRSTSSQTGGFVGYVSSSNDLLRCTAAGAVAGTSQTGGFVGQANGDRSQYVECAARGSVSATGYQSGGFVGQIGSTGLRFANCSALGSATSTSYDVGGFVGYVSNSNDLWRCFCAGATTGTYDVGGFAGNLYAANIAVRECFALGDATATRDGDAYAGGFAGNIPNSSRISDSYCLGTVKGKQKVGGFAGVMNSAGIVLARCYAAGALDCSGTYAGAFVGYLQNTSATFADCAVLCDGIFAVGSSTAGTSTSLANIAEYDAAGMKTAANFATWLAIDDADGSVWTQEDGVTQPYLAWSAPTGDLTVYASVGGSASGEVQGAGDYAPGATATVTAASDEGFFLRWTGSTPYADPTAATTTIPLDNHRVAAVLFGRLIRTADELDAVRDDLAGIYGLANDIDLAGRDWTPIGFNNAKFTGTLYGFGHAVENMVCTNSPGTQRHGLFGWTSGATLDGITVSGIVKATAYYTGGLVGCADATTIRDCHADCTVSNTSYYTGGLVGAIGDGTAISGCSAAGTVTSTSQYTGGLAGGSSGATIKIRDCVSTAETVGDQYVGGLVGYVSNGGESAISDCRADGYVCCTYHSVGGLVGYVSAPLVISNCVARGDVCCRRGYNYGGYGGFVGYLYNSSAVLSDNWCSGAVWGQGPNCGSFVGYSRSGTIRNCSIYAYGAGPRPFSGSDSSLAGGSLTAFQIEQLSEGWPEVKKHIHGATKIRTAEDLFAVTNNLAGIYALDRDIDLGGATWTPIGNSSTAFTGEFYGQNHVVSNFTVSATAQCAGFFGNISGGRVSGLRVAGDVSGTASYVGGFAGKIDSKSLVDGCSFEGSVTCANQDVGGFVGGVSDAPVVLRSCAAATVSKTGSANYAIAGGFVGNLYGYVMDCYALSDVEAGTCGQVGGFAGYVNIGSKLCTSYCSGAVTASGNYVGAFVGGSNGGEITGCYYDSGRTALLAVNNAANAGVAPLASAEMLHAANFPAFDFLATWKIDEGETTPYLRTFLVQLTGFQSFLEEYGFDADTDPLTVVNGIPLLARYVYGIVPMNKQTDNDGNPLVNIGIDGSGKPYFWLPPQKWADDYGMRFSVFWSRDLATWQTLGECYFDQDGDGDPTACHPDLGTPLPEKMFFKWRIAIAE